VARQHTTENLIDNAGAGSVDQTRKAEIFHRLHVRGNPVVLVNAWDAGSAKTVAAAGAKAVATSSWSVANANGFTDGERIPQILALENLRRIVRAVDLPVTVDLESGYGEGPEDVAATIRLAIEAGAIGCNLEDSFPANGKLRNMDEQADRIRGARRAARERNLAFFINARSDVFFQRPAEQHDQSMVEDAIQRAHAYAEAGADGLFAPGLTNITLIGQLAAESPLPLNVMVAETTPSLSALAQHRVARVSYGPQPYLLAMKALEKTARAAVM
jgi:2-methylisocitrate lyase-like PEP mutase family enzyme